MSQDHQIIATSEVSLPSRLQVFGINNFPVELQNSAPISDSPSLSSISGNYREGKEFAISHTLTQESVQWSATQKHLTLPATLLCPQTTAQTTPSYSHGPNTTNNASRLLLPFWHHLSQTQNFQFPSTDLYILSHLTRLCWNLRDRRRALHWRVTSNS